MDADELQEVLLTPNELPDNGKVAWLHERKVTRQQSIPERKEHYWEIHIVNRRRKLLDIQPDGLQALVKRCVPIAKLSEQQCIQARIAGQQAEPEMYLVKHTFSIL